MDKHFKKGPFVKNTNSGKYQKCGSTEVWRGQTANVSWYNVLEI